MIPIQTPTPASGTFLAASTILSGSTEIEVHRDRTSSRAFSVTSFRCLQTWRTRSHGSGQGPQSKTSLDTIPAKVDRSGIDPNVETIRRTRREAFRSAPHLGEAGARCVPLGQAAPLTQDVGRVRVLHSFRLLKNSVFHSLACNGIVSLGRRISSWRSPGCPVRVPHHFSKEVPLRTVACPPLTPRSPRKTCLLLTQVRNLTWPRKFRSKAATKPLSARRSMCCVGRD